MIRSGALLQDRSGTGEGSVSAKEISIPTCHSERSEESRPGPWREESERDSSLRSE
jgi:hypothetical protein